MEKRTELNEYDLPELIITFLLCVSFRGIVDKLLKLIPEAEKICNETLSLRCETQFFPPPPVARLSPSNALPISVIVGELQQFIRSTWHRNKRQTLFSNDILSPPAPGRNKKMKEKPRTKC